MQDTNDYRLESLSGTFLKHAEKGDENHRMQVENLKNNFPDQELPDHMKNPFNIARALSVMAAELEKLKIRCN